jgi:chloramphenicol 3-O phosphotransferase
VGLRCPIEVILERRRNTWGERGATGDAVLRAVHLWQRAVHTPGIYDLELDTSLLSPEKCAEAIRSRLQKGPPPSAIQRLAAGPPSKTEGTLGSIQ